MKKNNKEFILEFNETQQHFFHNYNQREPNTNGFITVLEKCTDEVFKSIKIKLKNLDTLTNKSVLAISSDFEKNIPKDKIVEDLKREFDIRSCVGIDKYKTTLQDNKHDDFLQHLKEELMDAALYIQKLQSK